MTRLQTFYKTIVLVAFYEIINLRWLWRNIYNCLGGVKWPAATDIGFDPILEFYFCRKGSGRRRPDNHRPALGAGKLK